jgi:NRPS condensation-like uncharacterized protein
MKSSGKTNVPRRIKANTIDKLMLKLSAGFDNQANVLSLEYKSPLNIEILKEAVKLSIIQEPILTYHPKPGIWRVYWEKIENVNWDEIFQVVNAENESCVKDYIFSGYDFMNLPQIQIRLFRSSSDFLVIKISKQICGGIGFNHYCESLNNIYNSLYYGHTPLIEPRYNKRSINSILNINFREKIKILKAGFSYVKKFPKGITSLPFNEGELKNPEQLKLHIGKELTSFVHKYAREKRATVYLLIITAIFRALKKINSPDPETTQILNIPIELGKYLNKGLKSKIINTGSGTCLMLKGDIGNSFDETLSLVIEEINDRKNNYMGANLIPLLFIRNIIPFSTDKKLFEKGMLTNDTKPRILEISIVNEMYGNEKAFNYGENCVKEINPVSHTRPPLLNILFYEFNKEINLSCSFYSSVVDKDIINNLFQLIKADLESIK